MDSHTLNYEYTRLVQKAQKALSRQEAVDCINKATKIQEAMQVAKLLEKR